MKRRKGKSAKSIINTSAYKLARESYRELQRDYMTLKRKAEATRKVYAKHKKSYALEGKLDRLISGASKKVDLIKAIGDLSNFFLSNKGSYSKYIKQEEKFRERAKKDTNIEFTKAEYEEYRDFLHEMYIRDKDNWKAHYDDAMDLYVQSRRLNLDPKQFIRNYKYWLEHASELAEADPLNYKRKLNPSDYARKLNLPKIRGGEYDEEED